ncbi:MAG: M3 family oligoendopeptidase [Proteobacteria bacterium]|nr:M3 family oligoendopeptidase [Pseudomonadota bacterium]
MTKNNSLASPSWDLSDFYSSTKDKKITADIKKIASASENFAKNFAGKITKSTAPKLFEAIKKYEEICEMIGKISCYSQLLYASDLSDQNNVSFYQNINEKLSEYEAKLIFFTIELNQIDDKKIIVLLKNSSLKKYQPFIRDTRSFKKYQLSHELEKFSLDKNITGRSAFVRLFDETVNNLKFSYRSKILNSQEIFDLTSNADEKVRKDAAKAIGKTFEENAKIFAFITNTLAKEKALEDKWRGFKKPISARNLSNFVEDEVVDTLVEKVKENYQNVSHRYYKIKAKILGKKFLNHWDRNAPLSKIENKVIAWEEAKNLVLSAYEEFHPEMKKTGEIFFKKNWIDAKVRTGKDSGAFSHPTIPSIHPYILMNYQGKIRDVMTLAHELGHGVHQYLARKQGYLMSGTPLTLAETASVFGEQLTFQKILKNEKNSEKKKLIIAAKVEDMINTAVRQIAFLEFEKKIHDERKNGEIPLTKICQFWLEVQKESLGPIFKFDEEYKFFWSYIPHFIHSPFYVYSYAFGECLVNSLYGVYKSGKVKNFSEKYLQMLEFGGTKHHKEMLAPFGLNAKDPKFWQAGLDVIINYIDQLEE